jgi:hypothetical protein
MTTHCVLRNVSVSATDMEFVPVRDVPFLNVGETIFAGDFTSQMENLGPNGSHQRTICLPVRRSALQEVIATACVLRDLGDGTGAQYVPASKRHDLVAGERMLIGAFRGQTEKHGPYGSHSLVVCLPLGKMFEATVPNSVN